MIVSVSLFSRSGRDDKREFSNILLQGIREIVLKLYS